MNRRTTVLPIVMVVVIVIVTLIMIATGRSNAPSVAGDPAYPHYVCTFNSYCAGPNCTNEKTSFVVYVAHENGQPRLDIDGMGPRATLEETPQLRVFESRGGSLSGRLTMYPNRDFDFQGATGASDSIVEHFGAGQCDRLKSP